jgi:tetraacyldisaccharide 4'-kinase
MSADDNRRRGPVPGLLGLALSPLYRAAVARNNRRFDAGRGVVRFDRPVISVGNLSVGGTGKTPMVAAILRALLQAGRRPCVAMRGYRSRGANGESDEAEEYRRAFPNVPVVARANRTLGLIQLFGDEYRSQEPHTDCIVLDDGFQHRQIARDLDVVLIDATRDPFDDRLLPAGWLREPLASLRRAGAVVITHAESVQAADLTALDQRIAGLRGRGADAVSRHAWRGLNVADAGAEREEPVQWLSGKRVFVVCAIGNPGPFLTLAHKAAGSLAGSLVLRDHDPYSAATVGRLIAAASAARAQAIVTTEKDWSKLAQVPATQWPCPIARPRLALTFDRGGDDLIRVVQATVARGAPE